MPIETALNIADLNQTWPLGTDTPAQGDDHLRLIKTVLKDQFPGSGGDGYNTPILATEADLNFCAGLSSSVQDQFDALVNADNALQTQINAIDSVAEAPIDNKRYMRLNSTWQEDVYYVAENDGTTIQLGPDNHNDYIDITNASPITIEMLPPVAPYGHSINLDKIAGSGDITLVGTGSVVIQTADGISLVLERDGMNATLVSKGPNLWKLIV